MTRNEDDDRESADDKPTPDKENAGARNVGRSRGYQRSSRSAGKVRDGAAVQPAQRKRPAMLGVAIRRAAAAKPEGPGSDPLAALEPMQRIALVREGVPAVVVESLANALGLSKEQLVQGLGLARATVNRKLSTGARLSSNDSERVLALAHMFDRVEQSLVGADAVSDGFAVGPWLGAWLTTPNAALGEERPLSLLDTVHGCTLVADALASMESGAYW